jgi:hypothetical protein
MSAVRMPNALCCTAHARLVEGHGAADVLGERVGRGGAARCVTRCRHDSHALRRQRARDLGADALVGARDLRPAAFSGEQQQAS